MRHGNWLWSQYGEAQTEKSCVLLGDLLFGSSKYRFYLRAVLRKTLCRLPWSNLFVPKRNFAKRKWDEVNGIKPLEISLISILYNP